MLDQPLKTYFAFARVHRVMTIGYLRTQEAHARRLVPTAELRPRMQQAGCLFWSAFGSLNGEFVADYQKMKAHLGARERRGAALCLHMLIGISPGWIERMGDLHDPRNIRVQQVFRAVRDFCDRHFNGVFAVRMDLDERGGGVVDVFATHAHERQARLRKNGGRGSPVTELSVKSALDEMSRISGAEKSFTALQTLWAEFAREQLDIGIVRGVPKKFTGREHLSTPMFRQVAERERELEEQRRGLLLTVKNTFPVLEEFGIKQLLREREQDERAAVLAARVHDLALREQRMTEREQGYTDWAAERFAYESSLAVRYSQVEIVQAEGEARLDQERAMFVEAKERADAAAEARAKRLDRRDVEARTKELQLAERETETERLHAEVRRRATDLEVSVAAADRSAADAERRAVRADAAAARYTTLMRQLIAGLSMIAKGALDDGDLEDWPDVQEVRRLLGHAFVAVDTRTAKERRALNDEQQRLAARSHKLDQRDAELAAQGRRIDQAHEAVFERSTAYERGVSLIASGGITIPADVHEDRKLAPAADLLTATLASVTAANDDVRRRALQMEERATRLSGEADSRSAAAAAQMRQAEAVLADGQRRLRDIDVAADDLATARAASDRHAAAWRVGVAEIEAGRLRSADDLAARDDLAPAAVDLIRAVRAIETRVEQRTRQAASQIALAAEERSRLAEERAQAQVAHQNAVEAVKKADGRVQEAEQVRTAANTSVKTANRVRSKMSGVLSTVSTLVEVAGSRNDIPADLVPAVRAVVEAHKALLEIEGRGRG